ncbi:hypothetical protein AB0I82_31845 [Streptomyces sp. NPDC050315]|uniref:hypothetical protein n=1 Tax=Streptomyces sp. NPDC050315 TaxID=3155039 RepID=UPI00341EF402
MTDNSPEQAGTSNTPPGVSDDPASGQPDNGSPDMPGPDQRRRKAPRWLVRAATDAEEQLADNTKRLALTFLANLVVLLGTGAVWYARGGDITLVGSVVGALLVLSGGMLPLIKGNGQDSEEKPLWPPLMLLVVPTAVLAVALPALAASVWYGARPVDLTHEFELKPEGPFMQGMTVTASTHTDRTKPRLFITFAGSEYDQSAPVCAPSSRFTVALRSGAGRGDTQSGRSGKEFVFELGRNHEDIRLAVRMTAEPNCALLLSVASARVDD